MVQLIINGVDFPESIKGNYSAWNENLGVQVEMISGRIVKEYRGHVWRIKYQYGFFDDAMKQTILGIIELGRREPLYCTFMPPHSNDYQSGYFFVTAVQYPTFMWSREGDPLWANFAFELREVSPHD